MNVRSFAVGAARGSLKATAVAVDVLHPPARGITILIYHRVGAGTGGQMDLTPRAFDDQLRWLVENTDVISLDDALARIDREGERPPRRSGSRSASGTEAVVLTFDDGTTDWVDNVLPALERHGTPATFYVATSFVDEQRPVPGDGRPISWSGLEEMACSELVTIGSHTHRHMLLDRLAPEDIATELDTCSDLLAEHLGAAPEHFAYPKAVAGSPSAEEAVRARFRSAVLAGTRTNPAGADPYRLSRSPIQASDTQRWFRRKAAGGMGAEDRIRSLANRIRYRKLDS